MPPCHSLPIADTPQKMVALGEDTLRDYIKTIGLFRGKAKNVIALSQQLIDKHGGKVPDDRAALEALPGVGRKTANVILNIAFGHPTIAVDTHLFRLGNRIGPGARQVTLRGGNEAAEGGSRRLWQACPSLADPARALCLQGAEARVLALPDRRSLPVQAEDACTDLNRWTK